MANAVPISALQHYLYCPRQCALIHVEGQWSENRYTAEGRILHERTDRLGAEQRRDVRIATGMPIRAHRHGLVGVADVVEFHDGHTGKSVFPVEYKRGRPKPHRADEVQLCAQALCLEEMLETSITEGALFYGRTRRRKPVTFDETLRALTIETAQRIRELITLGHTPAPVYSQRLCSACSLLTTCHPQRLSKKTTVAAWLQRELKE